MTITADVLSVLAEYAKTAAPEEACGFLVNTKTGVRVYRAQNTHESPVGRFRIDPVDVAAANRLGKPTAVWHSHAYGSVQPSTLDLASCRLGDLPWLIVNPAGDHSWTRPEHAVVPYIDRTYEFGLLDCWELARDWLRQERAVSLGRLPAGPNDLDRGVSHFVNNYEAFGFIRLPTGSPLEPGDVLLMQIRCRVPNHCGIIDHNGRLLHHAFDKLSESVPYGGLWEKSTTHHLRYSQWP